MIFSTIYSNERPLLGSGGALIKKFSLKRGCSLHGPNGAMKLAFPYIEENRESVQ